MNEPSVSKQKYAALMKAAEFFLRFTDEEKRLVTEVQNLIALNAQEMSIENIASGRVSANETARLETIKKNTAARFGRSIDFLFAVELRMDQPQVIQTY